MKKYFVLICAISLMAISALAQVSINSDNSAPDPSAILDVKSTNAGFLLPRMTTAQRNLIASPKQGLIVFNTDCEEFQYYRTTGWKTLGNSAGQIASPASISGNTSLCAQATGVAYAAAPVQDATSYTWTVPSGATIVSGQGTANIVVNYGSSGGSLCVTANNACYNSVPTCVSVTVFQLIASISITTGTTSVCLGTMTTFTTSVMNGGSTPVYQWRKNGTDLTGATNATYTYVPANGDSIRCQLTSNATCAQNNPAWSNMLTMTVNSVPNVPTAGTHVAALTEITWNWNTVSTATGYKWNITNDYATATDMGTTITKTETGLTCGTAYTRYVWAYNGCGYSTPLTLNQSALTCPFVCGTSVLTINHLTTGGVAPVDKTVTYNSVTNIPGETTKCWITKNLGATQQATAVSDATEASAGWYWQYNRMQGYKHDGSTLTPAWTITVINENSDWLAVNDPCNIELQLPWRLPTYTEWYNVDNTGGWTNSNGPWASGLKLHAAGWLYNSGGSLYSRGSLGYYWSSTQGNAGNGWNLNTSSGYSYMYYNAKANGFSVRCLRD